MRAREFLREQAAVLPPEQADPMRWTYVIPGLSASDPYRNYRFGVALARARSDAGTDGLNDHVPGWHTETAFGEHGVVEGMGPNVADIIDQALSMTATPGGKHLVSSGPSQEPNFVEKTSPVKAFKGYPR